MKTLYMETTQIQTAQTVNEIQRILGLYGAATIRIDYDHGEVASVSFLIQMADQEIPFRLPCRWEIIFQHLQRKRKRDALKKKEEDQAQAKRVAWRQILRWVEAQFALVDTGMAQTVEVFMPYVLINTGLTIYEKFEKEKFKMIEHKE